ncbi:MAG: hypothetical protein IT165_26425 [Bryobacterales bacterium]|nr:hypothetical protein [Bryobacterales bacterium]
MLVALMTNFQTNRKEALALLLERIHDAFRDTGHPQLFLRFTLSDSPVPGSASIVDRVLKRFPQLERFVTNSALLPGGPAIREITNRTGSPAANESVEFATLRAVAEGVPRSFPLHNVTVRFETPMFGEALPPGLAAAGMTPGITAGDAWWVNGRMRSLSALTIVDADPSARGLPPLPAPVATVLGACGKVKNTLQLPQASRPAEAPAAPPVASAETRSATAIVQDYRARLAEIVERAALPHDLPPAQEAIRNTRLGETTGPKKPILVRAFKPLGYDCQAGHGTFTLRRRTPGNLTVEISLDVGTWSRSITAHFRVLGLNFKGVLSLPVSKRAIGNLQYPIGDAERWRRIVENLAALTRELDRGFVPALEAAAGRSPKWYRPES